MPDIRESDPYRTDWLKFGTMEQALDSAVPPDMAQIGVRTTIAYYEAGPNFDADMLLLKGIMCGALCGVSATEVMHIMTDDMPESFFNYDHDDYLAELEKDELYEPSYVDLLAQCYYGVSDRGTHARRFEFVRKSNDGNSSYYFAGTVQVFRCVFQTTDLGAVNPDPRAKENPNFWVDVVYVQMEADGGPPGDLFLVKHVPDRS